MYESLARYYDLIHTSLVEDRVCILRLVDELGGPVLELGCGTGRLLIPIARAGYRVTGIDNSPAMLALARDHLDQERLDVQSRVYLIEADMKSLSLKHKEHHFALVLLPYNTLFHFHENEILPLFRRISPCLQEEGHIFIDIANPFLIDQILDDPQPSLENIFVDQESGETVRQFSQSQLYASDQCLHTSWIFEVERDSGLAPELMTVEFDYWYHYPHQLQLMLQQAGFHLERMQGNYDGSAFSEDSERLILIAQRV